MGDTTLHDRRVLRISGDDPRGFLNGLVTQDMASVTADRSRWAALLTPQGKVLFDFILWDSGVGDVLIDCEAAAADALARRLSLYRLRRKIDISPWPGFVHWQVERPDRPCDPRLDALGSRWLEGDADGDATERWRRHRLGLGVTEGQAELGSDATLCLECNAAELGGVSFTKGCYVGQENTARMHYRAKVNRRLIVAPIGEEGPRTRARYPEIGLMVELRRVEAIGDALRPEWLVAGLAANVAVD